MNLADDEQIRELNSQIQAERNSAKLLQLVEAFNRRLVELEKESGIKEASLG
jgi:hypothetical protein